MIPPRTNRFHLMPYWMGDSPAAVRRCARRVLARRFIDINLQKCIDGIIACHWGTAAQNGYRYIVVRGKGAREVRRKMTHAELHRPISEWKASHVVQWRRTARWGAKYASRVRPYTYEEMLRICKRWRVVPTFELKSRAFANKAVAKAMKVIHDRVGTRAYYMTLVTMVFWGPKMKAFKEAGFETALLPHGARLTPAVRQELRMYGPYIDRYWGGWRR